MTQPVFLWGPLAQPALLDVVLPARDAGGPDAGAERGLCAVSDAGQGLLLTLDAAAFARLDHYVQSLGLIWAPLTVQTDAGPRDSLTCTPAAALRDPWAAGDNALILATAAEIMAAFGQVAAGDLHQRLEPIRVRASSRLRAQAERAPTSVRRAPGPVQIHQTRRPYARFFAVEEVDLSFDRFDGAPSPPVTRAVFVSGDAVTVLPYDPVRDRVLLVEQFRAGPFGRGDANPWQLEAIAGRIDPGETPEACARREAMEEAGLRLDALHRVGGYYPSPGAKTEFLYSYVALTDLPDGCAGVFGVAEEAEDIRGHLLGFDEAVALVESGEVQNAPLILTLLWLQRERPRFRA